MDYIKLLRKIRKKSPNLIRGKIQKETLHKKDEKEYLWAAVGILLVCSFLGYLLLTFVKHVSIYYYILIPQALVIGIVCALLYLCAPLWLLVIHLIFHQKLPSKDRFFQYGNWQIFASFVVLSFGISYLFHPQAVHALWNFLYDKVYFIDKTLTPYGISIVKSFFIFWAIAFVVVFALALIFLPKTEAVGGNSRKRLRRNEFGLFLGYSTGELLNRKHGAALVANQPITLNIKDASKNILVLGGIGGGKTKAAINPLLAQLLDQGCGGLIFDIKGDFKNGVMEFAERTQTNITTIGPDHQPINVIAGLTPDTASEYLRSGLMLHGSGGGQEKHWVNAATILAKSVLGILYFIPELYSLENLYHFLHDKDFKNDVNKKLVILKEQLNDKEKRLLDHYCQQYDALFTEANERYQKDVLSTLNEVLTNFADPNLADAFCATGADMPNMADVVNGAVFLVDMPLSRWGMAGKIIYMFIKLRYFNIVQQRRRKPEWNQTNPIFFMCDEYQEIVSWSQSSTLSDLSFWDKAREANNIGIISAQSLSSFYSAINDVAVAKTILQNFRQKICFSTEDEETIKFFEYLMGTAETGRYGYGENAGKSSGSQPLSSHSSNSKSTSLHFVDKAVIDPQLFRTLTQGQTIASLNINGQAMDDVLEMFLIN